MLSFFIYLFFFFFHKMAGLLTKQLYNNCTQSVMVNNEINSSDTFLLGLSKTLHMCYRYIEDGMWNFDVEKIFHHKMTAFLT